MNDHPDIAHLTHALRELAASGRQAPGQEIERYLTSALSRFTPELRLNALQDLAREFGGPPPPTSTMPDGAPPNDMHRLIAHFIGVSEGTGAISADELAERFAGSLDTLFTAVNQIVSVMNTTLLGEDEAMATIRKVIGSNLRGETDYAAIKGYLDRIRKAFLVAHKSFQVSATTVIAEMLLELDPKAIENAKPAGLKFGPLRKAELFDLYEERYARCKRWFDSAECSERLLREFEKNCQQMLTSPLR